MAVEPAPTPSTHVPAAPVILQPQILCSALPDAYNSACSSGEQFLQSCLTYIHLREQYEQRKHTLDEYIELFQALVKQAAYFNGLQLCLTFWDGLHSALVEHINNLAEGRPNDEKIVLWYEVAWD
ncbi:hypothetical protein C0989_004841 [Termitomyces sp. Mn162]|nr:hypothetical protein C0989_004841 [Termitomyces sp. Mn162]